MDEHAGDSDAAAARLAAVSELHLLEQGPDVAALAETLLQEVPLPPNAVADAIQITLAAKQALLQSSLSPQDIGTLIYAGICREQYDFVTT